MRSLIGQISLRQMMIIVALMAFLSAIVVSYLQFHQAYGKGTRDLPADPPNRRDLLQPLNRSGTGYLAQGCPPVRLLYGDHDVPFGWDAQMVRRPHPG
jgi:hypothetical protein